MHHNGTLNHSKWMDIIQQFDVQNKSIALAIYTHEGKLLDCNEAMQYFLNIDENGETKNSIINPDLNTLGKTSKEGLVFNGMLTIGNKGDTSFTLQSQIIKKDDSLFVFCEADIALLFQENTQMSVLNQEINNLRRQLIKEKKTLQKTLKELQETQQMLIQSEKMNALGQLVAGVAHEINNPIAFINSNLFSFAEFTDDIMKTFDQIEKELNNSGRADLIAAVNRIKEENEIDYLFEDIPDLVKETKNGTNRIKVIIEDLRRFSRLDEAEKKTIDLIENIRSTIIIASGEFKKQNAQVHFHGPESLKCSCYPGQLNQALLNILINAAQAIGTGGNITISVKENKQDIEISIQDNGCGIDQENINKIFDPFFTTKDVGSGTGLGLSITHKIITGLHKGSIKVNTQLNQGTEFILSIPKSEK